MNSNTKNYQIITDEELMDLNGGMIPPTIGAALIGAAVTLTIALISADMQNAVEQGKNDAYNDIKEREAAGTFYHL